MASYQPPPWAKKPEQQWSLLEIKSGMEVATHPLHQACIVLGRQGDISLQHESCSRRHARIAFDGNTGAAWFRDLASTHGSTVNKKRLPAGSIGKEESMSTKPGARGVVLYPGDVIQLGASTRLFCVQGPEEFARGAVRKVVPSSKLAVTTEKAPAPDELKVEAPNPAETEGVSWGIPDDEPVASTATDEDSFKLPLDLDATIPDKHRKEWERIKALQYKLENITSESERIRRKGDLTEGQERQLQRNDQKQSELAESIREREQALYQKLYPEKAHASSKRTSSYNSRDDDEEDSDFYDRTKDREDPSLSGDGETEQSLTAKWKGGREQLVVLRSSLEEARRQAEQTESKLAVLKESGDEEAFFVQNDLDLAHEQVNKVISHIEQVELEMEEARKLLNVVNPKLYVDEATGYVGLDKPPPPSEQTNGNSSSAVEEPGQMLPPPPGRAAPVDDDFAMPPPMAMPSSSSSPPAPKTVKVDAEQRAITSSMEAPPLKRKRVLGPFRPPTSGASAVDESPPDTTSGDAPVARPSSKRQSESRSAPSGTVGTLAVLNAVTTGVGTGDSKRAGDGNRQGKGASAADDPKHDTFVLPTGQDGSGITKLNAKFGGRY